MYLPLGLDHRRRWKIAPENFPHRCVADVAQLDSEADDNSEDQRHYAGLKESYATQRASRAVKEQDY